MSNEVMFHDIVERELFLDLVAKGQPVDLAAIEVEWTPRRLKLNLNDPEFAEMVAAAKSQMLDRVEQALFELATKGKNLGAMQMFLYNKRPADWRDVRRIEVTQNTTITVGQVNTTVQATKALMLEMGVAALQPGGALDGVIDVESEEL